uniref:Uncharacterized protein n=1 Tax=Sphaerodactylus townsendi TaxID=933632 RepID=A0ACB8FGW2_9SAUR
MARGPFAKRGVMFKEKRADSQFMAGGRLMRWAGDKVTIDQSPTVEMNFNCLISKETYKGSFSGFKYFVSCAFPTHQISCGHGTVYQTQVLFFFFGYGTACLLSSSPAPAYMHLLASQCHWAPNVEKRDYSH